jgi:hypothetical protein
MNSARTPLLAEVVNRGIQLALARMFKVRVGRIESFDASKGLADVKPLQQETREVDGGEETYAVAVVSNVPVLCLGGGDYADTFPVQKGDECILVCADLSIDRWFEKGGDQDPEFKHRHNLTDAFAIVGLRSKPNALSEWPTDRREIGKQGGPRIAVKDDSVHLGVDSGQDATDKVALAPATKQELNDLRTALNNFVQTFNSHTHQVSTSGPPLAHTGTAAPTLSTATQADPVGDIHAEKVYAK